MEDTTFEVLYKDTVTGNYLETDLIKTLIIVFFKFPNILTVKKKKFYYINWKTVDHYFINRIPAKLYYPTSRS